jgi:hypothetical protein
MQPFMAQFTRSWPALAALGAALLFGAVGAGALGAASSGTDGAALAAALGALWIALAAGQAVFGLLALRIGSMPAPPVALALFLLPSLIWAALLLGGVGAQAPHRHASSGIAATAQLVQSAAPLPFLPLLIASALALGVAVQSAFALRRQYGSPRPPVARPARGDAAGGGFTLGLVIGSLAVSALVTPGLAATDAGRLAVPHGTHAIGSAESGAALSPAATAGTR